MAHGSVYKYSDPRSATRELSMADELCAAIHGGDARTVRVLLRRCVDVNAKCRIGGRPLYHALVKGDREIIRTLLQNRADSRQVSLWGLSCLTWFTIQNDVEMVELLLLHGEDPNVGSSTYDLPLYNAVRKQFAGILKLLIDNKALTDLDIPGQTVMQRAVRDANPTIVALLLNARADTSMLRLEHFYGRQSIKTLVDESRAPADRLLV